MQLSTTAIALSAALVASHASAQGLIHPETVNLGQTPNATVDKTVYKQFGDAKQLFDGRLPIHTEGRDNGVDYGIWAAGKGFKVSFHDGFEFVPYLGDEYPHNLPLKWKTADITLGGKSILGKTPRHTAKHTDWRYEYHWVGGVVEAYDIRHKEVEQTFTIATKPEGTGDLVVRGAITTELEAAPVSNEHTALIFHDANGNRIVRYGEAIVFDAAGRKTQVTTSFDGNNIELRVAGNWLAKATYPVTIDPISAPLRIASARTPGNGRDGSSIVWEDEGNDLYMAFTNAVSSADYDVIVVMTNSACGSPVVRYRDVTTAWAAHSPALAPQGAANRIVVAWVRRNLTGSTALRDDRVVATRIPYNTGAALAVSTLASSNIAQYTRPDVGGTAAFSVGGTNVAVVMQRDIAPLPANTNTSDIVVRMFNATTGALGPFRVLRDSASFDYERPNINAVADGANADDCWVHCWQQHSATNGADRWRVYARQLRGTDGVQLGSSDRLLSSPSSRDAIKPTVEGREIGGNNGRYLFGWAENPNTNTKYNDPAGRYMRIQAVDWNCGSPFFRTQCVRQLDDTGNTRDLFFNGNDYGYDINTQSHWKVVYHRAFNFDMYVRRIGTFDCLPVEGTNLNSGTDGWVQPSATFNDDTNQHAFIYYGNRSTSVFCRICRDFGPSTATLADTCANQASIGVSKRPMKGVRDMLISMNAPTTYRSGYAFLVISLNANQVAIPGGCRILINPWFVLSTRLNVNGDTAIPIGLPSAVVNFNFYADYLYSTVGLTGYASTRAVRLNVRG